MKITTASQAKKKQLKITSKDDFVSRLSKALKSNDAIGANVESFFEFISNRQQKIQELYQKIKDLLDQSPLNLEKITEYSIELEGYKDPFAIYDLSKAYKHQNNLEKATYYLDRAFSLGLNVRTELKNAYLHHGMNLHKQGKLDEAKAPNRRAAELGSANAMVNLGHILRHQNNFAEAIVLFEQAFALKHPGITADFLSDIYFDHGLTLHKQRKLDEAKAPYRRAAELGSTSSMVNLGHILRYQNNFAEAIVFYEQAFALKHPKITSEFLSYIYLDHGMTLHRQEKFDEAKAPYRRAVELGSANAMNHLGRILARQNNFEEAIVLYKEFLEKNPNHRRKKTITFHYVCLLAKSNNIKLYEQNLENLEFLSPCLRILLKGIERFNIDGLVSAQEHLSSAITLAIDEDDCGHIYQFCKTNKLVNLEEQVIKKSVELKIEYAPGIYLEFLRHHNRLEEAKVFAQTSNLPFSLEPQASNDTPPDAEQPKLSSKRYDRLLAKQTPIEQKQEQAPASVSERTYRDLEIMVIRDARPEIDNHQEKVKECLSLLANNCFSSGKFHRLQHVDGYIYTMNLSKADRLVFKYTTSETGQVRSVTILSAKGHGNTPKNKGIKK